MRNVLSIEEVFAGRLLTVPDYQRGYAWADQQVRDFIEDLELLLPGKEHYTGTLVVYPRPDIGSRMDHQGRTYLSADIVDGQQRLTTIVLLLDAIARELEAGGLLPSLAEGIRANYIAVKDLAGQPLLRLQLNGDTNSYWRDEVLAPSPLGAAATIASHRRLSAAHEFFRAYLAEHRGKEQQAWLLELYEKVTQRLRLTIYEVGEAAEVGVIFEVMNDRGKPLTELEKVKNYLLYVASRLAVPGQALADEVNRTWTHVFETLMEAGVASDSHENALLRAHWLINYDPSPASWDGAKSVKKRFSLRHYQDRHPELLDDLLMYARRLRVAATAYADMLSPNAKGSFAAMGADEATARAIRRASEKLRRLRLTATFTPVLIGARIAYPKDADGYLRLATTAERYAFLVYRLLERRSDAGFSGLARLGHDLVHGAEIEKIVERFDGLLAYYAPAQRVVDAFRVDSGRNWYWWRGLRYLLYEYEEHLANGDYMPLAWEQVDTQELEKTIEHILPQTPKDPYWTQRFTPEERKHLTHDLGNLVLTEHNPSLSNRPFPEKRDGVKSGEPCYARSAIFQEKALARLTEWTPATLEARRGALVAWALTRWAVAEPAGDLAAQTAVELAEEDARAQVVEPLEPQDEEDAVASPVDQAETPETAATHPPAGDQDQVALIARFDRAMEAIYSRAKAEIHYSATRFHGMVLEHGGYATAKRLLRDPEPHYGLAELFLAGRTDLSVEHHVLLPEFQELFTPEELSVARRRLGRPEPRR